MNFKKTISLVALLLLFSIPAHSAFFGVGFNYSLDQTTSMDSIAESLQFETMDVSSAGIPGFTSVSGDDLPITITRSGFDNLTGIGAKFWLEFIPVVDITADMNVYGASYSTSIKYPVRLEATGSTTRDFNSDVNVFDTTLTLDDMGFIKTQLDLAVRYPFFSFPPLVSVIKLYIGAGYTMAWSTPIISQDFVTTVMTEKNGEGEEFDFSAIENKFSPDMGYLDLINLAEEFMIPNTGIHFLVGAKVKPPVIPLTVYGDIKYHVLGEIDESAGVSGNALTVTIGAGLNI